MKAYRQGMFFVIIMMLVMSITIPAFSQNATPPASPVRLIFIHHSTGGHWLAASPNEHGPSGDLGQALMNNNYYVSATNYGWGPDGIGSRTDVVNWPEWFTGPNRNTIMAAVYAETGQNISGDYGSFGDWPRLSTNPGGENQIIMFKSCFPNSDIYGNPTDPPAALPNDEMTVANFKAVYNNILQYFASRQDKLFVVITAPPMSEAGYVNNGTEPPAATRAANARAFNNWLVNDWLDGYAHNNVAVFDYYNVLTSNGGNPDTNDTGWTTGNHHRWWSNQVQHIIEEPVNNYSAYPTDEVYGWDDHPRTAGQQKATAEFVLLLNYFYNRWKGGSPATSSYLLWTR